MKTTVENNIAKLDKEISTLIKHSDKTRYLIPSGSEITYSEFLKNKLMIVHVIRVGVPYSLFSRIQDYTPFSEKEWSEFLSISTKSLQRYKQQPRKFKPIQSEKIIEMAEVTNIGLDVFGEMEKFKLWLNTPSFALGNLKPIDLLRDSYGKEMVIGELTRINYGILV
jgi:putative toxin-antitoxin system antitoxin component (TIGR02293 family)